MYVQRYVAYFSSADEIAIFDRSWHNRAGVELAMGHCHPGAERFLELVPAVEKAMVDNSIIVIKYWLNVSVEEQTRRLENRDRGGPQRSASCPRVLQPSLRLLQGSRHDDRRYR